MLSKIFGPPDLSLTDEEVQSRRRTQRRVIIIAAAALILIVIGVLCARPFGRAIHGWQARRHAAKAFELIKQEQWPQARDEALAAYRLRSTEPLAIQAVARLFTRAGHPEALKFWRELAAATKLSRADLRDEAGLALKLREVSAADAAIRQLLDPKQGSPAPIDWLLAAQFNLQKPDLDQASANIHHVFDSKTATEREQFQATVILDQILDARRSSDRAEVNQRLAKFARSSSDVALDALANLAQRIVAGKVSATGAGLSMEEIIRGLETHSLAKPQHKLLAIDLRLRENPSERDMLIQKAIDQFKNGDNATLTVLAAWLNGRGEYQLELDTIPKNRAQQNRDLFLQHLDALGALGRWDEIRRLIEHEEFPLDPVIAHMYLARCFVQMGQPAGAENNWKRAMAAAAGDPEKLVSLGEYAEKNGVLDIAASAFEAAEAAAPGSRHVQQGRLRIAYAQHDTQKIHRILTELLKIWPNDTAVQNDEAYTRLLLMSEPNTAEVNKIADLAENLVKREPSSLPHRTLLGLARLKQNRPTDALAVYDQIQVAPGALSASALAVHVAILAANGRTEAAAGERSELPMDALLREEQALATQAE